MSLVMKVGEENYLIKVLGHMTLDYSAEIHANKQVSRKLPCID